MLVNLTGHPVNIIGENGIRINIQPSGIVARVEQQKRTTTTRSLPLAENVSIDVLVMDCVDTRIINLPDPEPGVYYIVSTLVAQLAQREDVIAPLTDLTAERDENNNIVGIRGFRRFLK